MHKLESTIVNNVFKEKEPKIQFSNGNIAKSYLLKYAKIIKDLSNSYVDNKKDNIALRMKEIDFVKAYALYYLPINFYKISFLLSKFPHTILSQKDNISLLDYGSGPATGALAVSKYFENIKSNLDITLYDKSQEMLNLGKKFLTSYKANKVIATTNIKDVKKNRYDIITILNAINEIDDNALAGLISEIDSLLLENGILIILEPALKFSTRRLMEIRNKILEKYSYNVLYPCFHNRPCEMLNSKDDWCHGELQGLNSRLVNELDDITGFNKHKIKYSCAIFYKGKINMGEEYTQCARVVSIPKQSNRGLSFNICALDAYKEVILSKEKLKNDKSLKKIKFFDDIKLNF